MNLRLFLLSNILLSVLISLSLVILIRTPQRPDASVLFGGQQEDGYPFVGYMMIENKDQTLGICGINYLSSRIAITAAHCLEKADQLYPNIGEVTSAYKTNAFEVNRFLLSPNYEGLNYLFSAGDSDIAVVEFGENVRLSEYATIGIPEEGCGYYITGYGRNEDGQTYERKGGSVCITVVDNERFELSTKGSVFFCQGDSGSGIYEYGTNRLVGLVSSFALIKTGDTCEEASNFFAVRADVNQSFINAFTTNISPNVPDAPNTVTSNNNQIVSGIGGLYLNVIESVGIQNIMMIYSGIVAILVIITAIVALRYYKKPQIQMSIVPQRVSLGV